jgi:gluconate 2-dehydrogenase gamma chain
MDRRRFVQQLAFAATLPFAWQPSEGFAAAVERSAPPTNTTYAPPLASDELALVGALAEGILPATDTPGALAAGVPEFIALLFSEWMPRDEQDQFRAGLSALAADTQARGGGAFTACTAEKQQALLENWDAASFGTAPDAAAAFFRGFKRLVVVGYYTSEVGQTVELDVQFGGGETSAIGPYTQPPPFRL